MLVRHEMNETPPGQARAALCPAAHGGENVPRGVWARENSSCSGCGETELISAFLAERTIAELRSMSY